jgi:hypothetical protein
LTCKGTLRQVFFRVYRLKIKSVMVVFSIQLCDFCPSNFLSGSPPRPPSLWKKYTAYTYAVCKQRVWDPGPQTDNTCRKVPFQVKFFRLRHFALPSKSLISVRFIYMSTFRKINKIHFVSVLSTFCAFVCMYSTCLHDNTWGRCQQRKNICVTWYLCLHQPEAGITIVHSRIWKKKKSGSAGFSSYQVKIKYCIHKHSKLNFYLLVSKLFQHWDTHAECKEKKVHYFKTK